MNRPRLAITMGDPCGVGPEIIAKLWQDSRLHETADCFVVGDQGVMQRAIDCIRQAQAGEQAGKRRAITKEEAGSSPIQVREVVEITTPEEAETVHGAIPCLAIDSPATAASPGEIDPIGGQAAYEALVIAAELAMSQRVDAIVTAPLHKAALHAAGHNYPGHTELLADLCEAPEVGMMLYLPPRVTGSPMGLGVVHVTLHMALRRVFDKLCKTEITTKIQLADTFFRALQSELFPDRLPSPPRIGVCALNPHAGEEGLFGTEERRIIQPAVDEAAREGFQVAGPFPADTLLTQAAEGAYDAVVAMYHDQGHIALKLLGMHHAVNVTLGLPIIRTSVAHGTAFDQAWDGTAKADSLWQAVQVAARLGKSRPNLMFKSQFV